MTSFAYLSNNTFLKAAPADASTPYAVAGVNWDGSVTNRPGAVHDILGPLKTHGVSMTRFESRPARSGQWEYYFYIDLQGHTSQSHVGAALAELQQMCAFFKVLGTYPAGD